MTNDSKTQGQQPEVLAGLAAAAKAGGQKPKSDGLVATPGTAPVRANPAQEVDAATTVLREGATGTAQGAQAAVKALPDRARQGNK